MRPALPGRPKALLLDDDPAVLRLLGRELSARGLDVLAAADGAAGLDLLLEELLDLDVLVVDLDLPGRDAWDLLRLIRDAGGEEDLPVAVLVHRPDADLRARLLALGADAVVDRALGPVAAARAAIRAASPAARRLAIEPPARLEPAARLSPPAAPQLAIGGPAY